MERYVVRKLSDGIAQVLHENGNLFLNYLMISTYEDYEDEVIRQNNEEAIYINSFYGVNGARYILWEDCEFEVRFITVQPWTVRPGVEPYED